MWLRCSHIIRIWPAVWFRGAEQETKDTGSVENHKDLREEIKLDALTSEPTH